ncbi:hypothetical protein GF322_04095 [Candidatus Dependentiae bacterium]|nr:hypothetical protein [Candidatus Dependentiae bacterium]
MKLKEYGFIIKRFFPQKQKISVISKQVGKIELITNKSTKCHLYWPGMLISFFPSKTKNFIYLAENIEIISTIQNIQNLNFYWFCRLLEICYYFVRLENPCTEIFFFLNNCMFLIENNFLYINKIHIIKKIYELKFLVLLGFYPSQEHCCYLDLYNNLTSLFIDFENKAKVKFLKNQLNKINTENFKKLEVWINKCLNNHPYSKKFKTIKK